MATVVIISREIPNMLFTELCIARALSYIRRLLTEMAIKTGPTRW